jgi:hypothetical protein
MANVPPLARAVLVWMGFNIIQMTCVQANHRKTGHATTAIGTDTIKGIFGATLKAIRSAKQTPPIKPTYSQATELRSIESI